MADLKLPLFIFLPYRTFVILGMCNGPLLKHLMPFSLVYKNKTAVICEFRKDSRKKDFFSKESQYILFKGILFQSILKQYLQDGDDIYLGI